MAIAARLFFPVVLCAMSGCPHTPRALVGCGVSQPAAGVADPAGLTLQLDYSGAEALVAALERDSLDGAQVDSLLRVRGVRAMVDNVTRFVPGLGVPQFRSEIEKFVRRKRPSDYPAFQLADAWRERSRIADMTSAIRTNEGGIRREVLSLLERYRPDTGPLAIGVYFVAGGVSDGFVFENDPAFYINLARAGGDCREVALNIAHEAYHVLQTAAQRRSGTLTSWVTDTTTSPVDRVLAGTLLEGTANFVADPARLAADSSSLRSARDRFRRNAEPERIAENFAVFDAVVRGLREGTLSWQEASARGFMNSPRDETRFYFVGYEMAQAIERYCGPECIGKLFGRPPVEFFRQYIALYRAHPEIRWHFAPMTMTFILSEM